MGISNIDLNLLKTFVIVSEEKSFTLSAKKLFVEQSSVSKAIKRLEEDIGMQLFLRTKRKVQLTSKGESLYFLAKNILLSAQEFVDLAQDKEKEITGSLKFGAESPISFLYMPEVLAKLTAQHQKLWPIMYTGITDDIVKRVKNRELEIAFIFYEGNRLKELTYQELGKCNFKVVASTKICPAALNSFIGSREVNDQISLSLPTFEKLRKINKALTIKYSANDIAAYKELILNGMGIGLLPEKLVNDDLKNKKLKHLYPELKLKFSIHAVYHASQPLSLEADCLIESLANNFINT
jgi:DNA-binding transcriptional LysR family regulator